MIFKKKKKFFIYSHPRNTYFKNFGESAAGYFLPKGFLSNQESQDLYHQYHFHKIQEAYDDLKNTVTKVFQKKKKKLNFLQVQRYYEIFNGYNTACKS